MFTVKFLSGEELVAKGATKIESTLPEVGQKDVMPNGSWLEQKQIQAALEARKHLIEIERIGKSGALSHAEWQEDLKVAKIIKKTGSYWQYLGHNVGNQLFLKPEETLFLMEVNCLHLKYNGVTVSLQQAYSLLLRDEINILQYRIYSSLSRLGYRVFRHEAKSITHDEKSNLDSKSKNSRDNIDSISENNTDNNNVEIGEEAKSVNNSSGPMDTDENDLSNMNQGVQFDDSYDSYNYSIVSRIQKLKIRRSKHIKFPQHLLDNLSEILHKTVIHVNTPDKKFVPEPITFTNKNSYILNIRNISEKTLHSESESRTYSIPDEVSDASVPRIQDSHVPTPNSFPQNFQQHTNFQNQRRFSHYPQQQSFFRAFCFQRQHNNPFHAFTFNTGFNASFGYINNFYNARFNLLRSHYQPLPRLRIPRQHASQNDGSYITFDVHNQNRLPRKRNHNTQYRDRYQAAILASIKQAAFRLKQQRMNIGIVNETIFQTLQNIVREYNIKYRTALALNSNFDIVDEEVIETIDLENESLSDRNKKRRKTQPTPSDEYVEHLNAIKQLAVRMKMLVSKGNLCAKDKRAFSKLLKTFNNTHKSDVYINDDYEICDRRHIVLDSSSDSDCILEEDPAPKPKKLRNPFNILNQLSSETKNLVEAVPSTSSNNSTQLQDLKNDENIAKTFNEHWCPKEDDFGHVEIVPKNNLQLRLNESNKMDYLYAFMLNYKINCDNWIDLKICFWNMIKENGDVMNEEYKKITQQSSGSNDKNAFKMSKKSLIKSCKDIPRDTNLKIHFDVYERDVQNFKKSQRPPPHFRIICLEESSEFPSGGDIAAIHSLYSDNVPIVFAVVCWGSISYLQMKPENLPVNVREHDNLL